jgi:hypothetical protein
MGRHLSHQDRYPIHDPRRLSHLPPFSYLPVHDALLLAAAVPQRFCLGEVRAGQREPVGSRVSEPELFGLWVEGERSLVDVQRVEAAEA